MVDAGSGSAYFVDLLDIGIYRQIETAAQCLRHGQRDFVAPRAFRGRYGNNHRLSVADHFAELLHGLFFQQFID